MSRSRLRTIAATTALAMAAPLLIGTIGPRTNLNDRLLAAHNWERSAAGLPKLQWNEQLAADARAWADTLGRTGRFEHAPRKRGAPQGENLWAGTRGYYSPEAMVGLWIAEKRNFRPGRFPNNSRTGRVADVGHYTQLMWRSSQQVGCAVATGAAEDVLVCRYSTPGNILGQTPF